MTVPPIRYASLFSGIGGFDLGLDRAGGFKRVWSCDWNTYANQIYFKRFKPERGTHWTGDIRRVPDSDVPSHDLLTAGFPCQSFSIAGPREGFESTRGTLFYEIARIANAKKPSLLLLENVEGLLNHSGGHTFKTILAVLGRLGYRCEWQTLNTDWFGIPQHRERVFIVGHLGTEGGRQIFPIRQIGGVPDETAQGEHRDRKGVRRGVSPTIDGRYGAIRNAGEPYIIDVYNQRIRRDGKAGTLKGEGVSPTSVGTAIMAQVNQRNEVVTKKNESFSLYANPPSDRIQAIIAIEKGEIWPRGDDKSPALRAQESKRPTIVVNDSKLRKVGNIAKSGHDSVWGRVYSPDGVAATLNARAGGVGAKTGLYMTEEFRPRRLTPVECERLQGFPDGWTQGLSDTRRYECLGNAVTVDVVEFLAERIKEVMNHEE